jgi:two-component system, cell cycle response regulator DivK
MQRILLVEDNAANQLLASAVLQRDGFEVEVADSAQEALRVVQQRRPDLILMDIQLPEMDGLALTRQLKADPDTESITVVALTAHAMVGDKEEAISAGCAGYIPKPIDTRTLGEQVRGFLQPQAAEAGS